MSKKNGPSQSKLPYFDDHQSSKLNSSSAPGSKIAVEKGAVVEQGRQGGVAPLSDADPLGPEAFIEGFFRIWLPIEIEIMRLAGVESSYFLNGYPKPGTEALPGQKALTDAERETRQLEIRRALLEQLFADAGAKNVSAIAAVEALKGALHLFIKPQLETDDEEADEEEAHDEVGEMSRTPMELRELAGNAEFLQKANAYSALFQRWLLDSVASKGDLELSAAPGNRLAPRTQSLPAIMRFFNDAVHGVAVRALARPAEWEPREGFAYAFEQLYGKANVTIGLPNGESAQSLWEFLRRGGPRMVKAHYALWARYYENYVDGGPRYVVMSVPQFCSDIGLKKHKNGGFRPEQKREAMKMLQAIAAIEMRVEKTLPNGTRRRLRGPLWGRGLQAEELSAQSRTSWEATAFSFAPGPWFDDPEWRRYHQFMGKIGAGLLRLSSDTDQWAILIGGYLGTLGRNSAYGPLRLRVETILRESGLAQSGDARRRMNENRTKFEAALDRLAAPDIAVILQWRFVDSVISEPDMDDAQALAQYGMSESYPPGDWRGWLVEIELPFQADRERLQAGRTKAKSKAMQTSRSLKK